MKQIKGLLLWNNSPLQRLLCIASGFSLWWAEPVAYWLSKICAVEHDVDEHRQVATGNKEHSDGRRGTKTPQNLQLNRIQLARKLWCNNDDSHDNNNTHAIWLHNLRSAPVDVNKGSLVRKLVTQLVLEQWAYLLRVMWVMSRIMERSKTAGGMESALFTLQFTPVFLLSAIYNCASKNGAWGGPRHWSWLEMKPKSLIVKAWTISYANRLNYLRNNNNSVTIFPLIKI